MTRTNTLFTLAMAALLSLSACHKTEEAKPEATPEPAEAAQQAPKTEVPAKPAESAPDNADAPKAAQSLYDFTVKSWDGKDVSLKDYAGKVVLVVNTATACGFTPQYDGLEALYQKYHEKGLEILDFPCNQFGQQAPGTDQEIHDFRANEYKVSFPQFAKIDVNGENADPFYRYLVSLKGFAGFDPASKLTPILDEMLTKSHPDYKETPDIKWNFTKFLFDREGKFVDRYEPTTTPEGLDAKIAGLL